MQWDSCPTAYVIKRSNQSDYRLQLKRTMHQIYLKFSVNALPIYGSLFKTANTFFSYFIDTRGGLRGGGHFRQVPGASRFRGAPQIFGTRGCLWPMFFGTAPHGFGRTYHICRGALGPRILISNMNRVLFCPSS